MSEITYMLDQLAAKKTTIGAVAANFATRTWPKPERKPGTIDQGDPEPIVPNSWGEVVVAHSSGKLTDAQ